MKRQQKGPRGIWRWRRPAVQQAKHPRVRAQHREVVQMLPAVRQKEDEPLDQFLLAVARAALTNVDVVPNRLGQAERPERLEDHRKPGASGHAVLAPGRIVVEPEEPLLFILAAMSHVAETPVQVHQFPRLHENSESLEHGPFQEDEPPFLARPVPSPSPSPSPTA